MVWSVNAARYNSSGKAPGFVYMRIYDTILLMDILDNLHTMFNTICSAFYALNFFIV